MAEWSKTNNEKIKPAFAAIRSLFLDGTIDKMYKLINYNPTKVAKLFSMSYKTFHEKLREPWRFSTFHILLLAKILEIDPEVINRIIQTEAEDALNARIDAYRILEQKAKENSVKASKTKN